jgi:hypothetical protein
LSTKIEQLQWRRSKVVEMRARGMSQARRDLDKNSFESNDQSLYLLLNVMAHLERSEKKPSKLALRHMYDDLLYYLLVI